MAVTAKFYETHAEAYVQNTATMADEEWLSRFSSRLPAGGRVLDVGCAAGRDSAWFASRGYVTVGIDIVPTFVEMARRDVPSAQFHVMDVRSLSFADASFDGVWCSCVLIHIAKSEFRDVVSELRRILKPGGVIYLLVKAGTREGYEPDPRYGGAIKYSSYFSLRELADALCGFVIEEESKAERSVDNYRAPERLFVLARRND